MNCVCLIIMLILLCSFLQKVDKIWRADAFGYKVGRKALSKNSTRTIIFGKQDTTTAIHMDWSGAFNLAFEVTDKSGRSSTSDKHTVVALWAFIHPKALPLLNSALVDLEISEGTKVRTVLTPVEMRALQAKMGRSSETGHYWLTIVEQRSGEIVQVPPGWAHCVYNKNGSAYNVLS